MLSYKLDFSSCAWKPGFVKSSHKFALAWEFKHITTSPRYPSSNGKAESAVKICKTPLKKSQVSKSDLYLALLDHRNTPTEQTNLSPAQRLFGCQTRTLLPLSPTMLQPQLLQPVGLKIAAGQAKQAKYYNQTAKPLKALQRGQSVRMKLPGDDKWSLGTYMQTRSGSKILPSGMWRQNISPQSPTPENHSREAAYKYSLGTRYRG